MKARLSEDAELDIEEIADRLAAYSQPAADRFLDEFYAKAAIHAGQPHLGRPRPDIMAGIRTFVVEQYVVFFRPVDDTISVERVILGTRDLPAAFHRGR